jgi:uncharacterized protein (DUF3084 family)
MYRSWKKLGCLIVLAIPLSISRPAYAQQTGPVSGTGNDQMEERAERQEFREERENIRAAHEQLETEHDMLKMRCMDAKGQDRNECQGKKEALRQKQEALHERMKALHEKITADQAGHRVYKNKNEDHTGEWKKHHNVNSRNSGDTRPKGQTPAPSTPAPESR